MPSNATPNLDSGLTYLPKGDPDTTNPLYGTPAPVSPLAPSNFFTPAPLDLPVWDSASWLEKVKNRFLDNPKKNKPTLEESNNWGKVQEVLKGNPGNLDSLLNSMYLDDALYEEAKKAIEDQKEANADLIKNHEAVNEAAKKSFQADNAEAKKKYETDMVKFRADEKAWNIANPTVDALEAVKLPETSKEAFSGTVADWSKAHVGTHSLDTVLSSIQNDKALGVHGLSVATDSDQIEDLDMKITRVLSSKGVDSMEVKFKMTAPHGKVTEEIVKAKSGVIVGEKIYPSKMVMDKKSGLFKDSGAPTGGDVDFIRYGSRYEYIDPETGATVVFQKANGAGLDINSNNNTVKIHLPIDAPSDSLEKTLSNLGVINARPATQGDIKVLAENKLISMMGTESDGIKAFDGRENIGGPDRAKILADIKSEHGVGPEDMTFSVESNGKVRFQFSDEFAKKQVEKYDVGTFMHSVSSSNNSDLWFNMLTGPTPGLLSTYHRFTEGIGGKGLSSEQDMNLGSSDYIYLTPKSKVDAGAGSPGNAGYEGVYVKPTSIFKRSDFWANPGDGYGKKSPSHKVSSKTPYEMFKSRGVNYDAAENKGMYEILPKDSVSVADWSHIVVSWQVRDNLINRLKKSGMTHINGIPLEEFILLKGADLPPSLTTASGV